MSKGSNRRPGDIPAGNWEAIFGKKPEKAAEDKSFVAILSGNTLTFYPGIDIDAVHKQEQPDET